ELKNNVDFQTAQDVIHAFEVAQVHGLDFAQVHVARQPLRSQVFDECVGAQFLVAPQPLAGGLQLVGIQLGRKPKDFIEVQSAGRASRQKSFRKSGVILDFEAIDAKGITALS